MVERPLSIQEVPGSIPGFYKENENDFAAHGSFSFFCWLSAHKMLVVCHCVTISLLFPGVS